MNDILIHLGTNSRIDGGPYQNCEVTGFREGEVVLRDQSGHLTYEDPRDIEDNLADEMEADQPISVSGVHPDEGRETLYLPAVEGFLLDVFDGSVWAVGSEEWEANREAVVRTATAHGASLGPN